MGDFYEGPQNNFSRVVHALRRIDPNLPVLKEAIPIGRDLLAKHGPNLDSSGGEIRIIMVACEINWDDIATQGDLIALVELANELAG
jgi:hypothetical protein